MITYGDKEFSTKKELFNFLVENKRTIIKQKLSAVKKTDGIVIDMPVLIEQKAIDQNTDVDDFITVKVVINTTNVLDSHDDVHMPGIWDKTISENKNILFVQEHKSNEFDKIIADGVDLKVYVQKFTWLELGYPFSGETEALVFEAKVYKTRNPFMYDQYSKGYVKNHSVGMQYVWKKIFLCIDDEEMQPEYDNWKKYRPLVANGEKADESGYFWAVNEAKVIEGSAVPIGSNHITPTLEVKQQAGQPLVKDSESRNDALLQAIKNFQI